MKRKFWLLVLVTVCFVFGSVLALNGQTEDVVDLLPEEEQINSLENSVELNIPNGSGAELDRDRNMEDTATLAANPYFNVRPVHTGDFNGDGYTDLAIFRNEANCWSVNVYPGNGNGSFGVAQRWATQQGGYWAGLKWFTGDFNGDGKTDFAKYWNDNNKWTVDVHLSTGTSFIMQRWAGQQGGYWDTQKWYTGDFNGDGRTDFAKFWDDNGRWTADVHLSTGNAFVMQRWATQQQVIGQKWFTGDFNGDGRTDFAIVHSEKDPMFPHDFDSDIWVHLSTGSNFNIQRWLGWSGYRPWPGEFQTLVTGDFNGDGRTDMAGYTYYSTPPTWSADVYLSTGSVFMTQRWATNQGGYWEGQQWFTGDFNGDGRTDFAKFWNENGKNTADVHAANFNGSTGSFQMQRWATQQGTWLNNAAWFPARLYSHVNRDLIQLNEDSLNAWFAGWNSFCLYTNDSRYIDLYNKEFAIFETNGPQVFKRFVNGEWFWELCTSRNYDIKVLIANSGDKKSPSFWMQWLEDGRLMDYSHIPGYGWYPTGGLLPDESYWTATFFNEAFGGNHSIEAIVNAPQPNTNYRIPESSYNNNNWMEYNVYPWPRAGCF